MASGSRILTHTTACDGLAHRDGGRSDTNWGGWRRAMGVVVMALSACDAGAITQPQATITSAEPTLTQLAITPASASLTAGQSWQFSVSGTLSDGSATSVPVTWSTTEPEGSVDGEGLYSAGQTAGVYEVVATDPGSGLADTALVTVTVPEPPPPGRSIIWSAGMEVGDLSEWTLPGSPNEGGGEFNSGGDSWASQDVAHGGNWSLKMELSEGSGGTRLFRWREPAENPEAYYSVWYYFPTRYEPDSWWNIFQFKSKLSDGTNDPFWLLTVQNRADGSMYVALDDWINKNSYSQDAANLPVGSWVHLECYLRQSAQEDGQLKCWQDGILLWDLDGITTHYPGSSNQWSVNNYSSGISPAPATIYVDDASITVPASAP